MSKEKPQIIKEVGFNFDWDVKKVWALKVPSEEMAIDELIWHFDIPFWEMEGTDDWNLTPWEVVHNPGFEPSHYRRIQNADIQYPLDIAWNKGRWTLLDGLHRLVNVYLRGNKTIMVRKINKDQLDSARF